uniref:Uncharacterized protein n=1 Tax=Hemiselmis andersenii TaxID=464988 RepID=A0A7S1DPS9_HEMAN|mmetsp:Transcript_21415/g.51979  ORF Transcript_21415/g.51979 Transcript_21415/m.51979 type:complete len:108 (+) Transcript_21415:181-504(+)
MLLDLSGEGCRAACVSLPVPPLNPRLSAGDGIGALERGILERCGTEVLRRGDSGGELMVGEQRGVRRRRRRSLASLLSMTMICWDGESVVDSFSWVFVLKGVSQAMN